MIGSEFCYRADVDGLRAIAVIAVVLFHAFPNLLPGGFIGVDIFFVISGYLITQNILKHLQGSTFTFSDFYRRRVRRLCPSLIVVTLASLVFGFFCLLAEEFNQLGKHVASSTVFIINFILAGETGYFDSASIEKPMLHLWSLSVEEQFYVVWPTALWLAWRFKVKILVLTSLCVLASLFLALHFTDQYPARAFYWSHGRFWEILAGGLLASWLAFGGAASATPVKTLDATLMAITYSPKNLRMFLKPSLMSGAGLSLLFIGILFLNEDVLWPSKMTFVPVVGTLLLIAAGPTAYTNKALLSNSTMVWFGLISYPLYLWHWPILSYLHIVNAGSVSEESKFIAVMSAVALAWLTYRYIEFPIRFGKLKSSISSPMLFVLLLIVGYCGFFFSKADLSYTHVYEDLLVKRKGLEHARGNSLRWYQGDGDWLFLGNSFGRNVAKLKGSETPSADEISALVDKFSALAASASDSGTQLAFLVAPNKANVYPERLPSGWIPAQKRYSTFFTDKLRSVDNLSVYDPVNRLKESKETEGILYYRTDSHWNAKGAFIAFSGLIQTLGLSPPDVSFTKVSGKHGDLIHLSNLTDFPVRSDDNWDYEIAEGKGVFERTPISASPTSFGPSVIIRNSAPPNEATAWIVGDSFVSSLRPFINATFREVHYLGHWDEHFDNLVGTLENAEKKPDYIIFVRVERSI